MPSGSDRVAVVTGAGGDIGGACARRLAMAADVMVCVDRDAERTQSTVDGISSLGGRAVALVADADADEFGAEVARVVAPLGSVRAVVHAIAFEEHRPAAQLTTDSLRRSFAVGPVAAFSLFQQLHAAGCLASAPR